MSRGIWTIFLLVAILATYIESPSFAETEKGCMTIQGFQKPAVTLCDFEMILQNGRVYLPIDKLAHALPYNILPGKGIGWNHEEKRISLFGEDYVNEPQYRFSYSSLNRSVFNIGSKEVAFRNKPVFFYKNSKPFFPLREIMEAYGAKINWKPGIVVIR